MAKGINKVFLLGNVGRDPEVRVTNGGTKVASFSLATPDRRKENGEWVEATEWHNCIAFGRTAEILGEYALKGAKLHIEGKLQTRSWDDKESGQKRYKTEVLVNDVTLLGSPQGKSNAKASPEEEYRRAYPGQAITDDDVPF